MKSILIKSAAIVNEGTISSGDVLLKNGRIERIAGHIAGKGNETEINADGMHLLPGIIDDQVHFREPGLTHKATIYTEAKAGIAGGVTSFMEMPNTKPPALSHELLEQKYRTAQITSLANYSFYLGTSNDNLEEIKKTDPKNVCGIKVFMGSSTGKLAVDNQDALASIFRDSPTLVATHCETDSLIHLEEERFKEKFGNGIPIELHPVIRNEQQCLASSTLAVELANKYNTRLHILHISTADELALFGNSMPLASKQITAEACVHHLYFDSGDYEKFGPQIKCNPAIKDRRHKEQLLQALNDDRLDIVATDHAPHTWNEKYALTNDGKIDYFKSPSGLPLIQHSLNVMLEFFHQGKITLEKIAEKMSHAPAICFKIQDRGFIREGYFADLCLLDVNQSYTVAKENLYYKCGWSPFEGKDFKGRVIHTFVNGRLVYSNGAFDESINGMRLEFER